jgi:hypothetical protein
MAGLGTVGPFGTFVTVGNTSGLLISNNNNRNGLIVVNPAVNTTVWIVPGNLTAASNAGITVLPQGTTGDLLMPRVAGAIGFGAAWNAISSGGPVQVLVLEFFGG